MTGEECAAESRIWKRRRWAEEPWEEDNDDDEEMVFSRPAFSIERVEMIGFRHGTRCEMKRPRRGW